jgi:elongation factor G
MDGVKGVESQTQKVWSHAEKTNIPRICFINKMDRIGSSVIQTAQQIKERLQAEPLILQYPIGEAETFKGVVDLIEM